MITHEQFVESLGEFAKNYTEEQLQRLHHDVKEFARIVTAIYKVKDQDKQTKQKALEDRIQELPL